MHDPSEAHRSTATERSSLAITNNRGARLSEIFLRRIPNRDQDPNASQRAPHPSSTFNSFPPHQRPDLESRFHSRPDIFLFAARQLIAKMANFLASIFGTELDKVNCSFYFKIGACRHGDRCSRKHVKPSYSQTILMPNLYQNPAYDPKNRMNPSQLQNHFDAFYEDIWCELCKYGELEELVVCDNNNDRMSFSPSFILPVSPSV